MSCPMCGSENCAALGQLGELLHIRCAACGWIFSVIAREVKDDE